VRPYAFALLLTNLTILMFLRWMNTNRMAYAAFFGMAAGIFYFQYLFASILAALAVYYLVTRRSSLLPDLRHVGIALGCFAIFMLPVLPRLKYTYQTRTAHSFADAPEWTSILGTLNPFGTRQLLVLVGGLVVAALAHKLITRSREMWGNILLCGSLALVPILCLYTVSVTTSVHIFIPRYLLVAMPGIALCWGWPCSAIDSRLLRGLFCLTFGRYARFKPISRQTLARTKCPGRKPWRSPMQTPRGTTPHC
jgi:hypothetical protein